MNSEILDRLPPQDLDAERAVIGSILLDPPHLDEVREIVRPEDFHADANRRLYSHFLQMRNGGTGTIDTTLLLDHLRQAGDLEAIGGESGGAAAYLAEVAHSVPYAANAAYYARIVRDKAESRRVIHTAAELLHDAYNGVPTATLRSRLESTIERIDAQGGIQYKRLSCAELDAGRYDLEYLIDRTLVAGQPCIVAGGKKCLKTSIILDMGISLAVGGFFLGKLKVNRACRVGIMTGESGLATIQETARRICRAAGYRLGDIGGLVFSEDLPQFGSRDHEDALRRFIMDDELEVLAIDPAYLCLPGADAGNLFTQGDLLRGMSKVCSDTGCTMILAHHTRKTKTDPFSPPELEDIAWAGFQEFARQWLLVGRREAYEPGTGEHRLWLSVGGSAGHTALWALDISEGTRESEGGRFWQVGLMHADEARAAVKDTREQSRKAKADADLDTDRRKIVEAVVKLPDGETKNGIRDRVGCGHRRFDIAFASLVDDGTLQPATVTRANNQKYEGWKLRNEQES
ncbi:MAG: AAA family ATPase [Planctomycetaceae bacterium]|nr:AAA family ATPase [Planctomycetaceae bacterium]